jgi:hypothetical protein
MLKKALDFYTKYFAVWVVACGVVAYFWPEVFLTLRREDGLVLRVNHRTHFAACPSTGKGNELVLRPYDVRHRGGSANRRFQTNRKKAGHRF